MDDQRGPQRLDRRRFLLLAGVPLLAAGAGAAYALWPGPRPGRQPQPHPVRTDVEPLNRRFRPYLGELTAAHWIGYDIDERPDTSRSIPGPDSRIRVVGIARMPDGGAAAIVRDPARRFDSAAPSALPAELEPHLPAAAAWQHSPEFDAYANRPGGAGAEALRSGEYLFDTARDLVCFDILHTST